MGKIIFIVGPTAAGKTKAAHSLALRTGAAVVSCDSVAIYRGMDIISGKPSAAMRREAAYHMLDVVSPGEEYDVAKFIRAAAPIIQQDVSCGKTILVVGGSGLYVHGLLYGLFEEGNNDDGLRKALEVQAKEEGAGILYERLRSIDPLAAAKIHPRNLRRVIRALEVCLASGERFSSRQKRRKGLLPVYKDKVVVLGLACARDELYRRINERVDKMFEYGLVEEVRGLLKNGLSRTASQALGIKEVGGYLEGKYDLRQAKDLLQRNTRHFAKRQQTWFKRNRLIRWVKPKGTMAENATF